MDPGNHKQQPAAGGASPPPSEREQTHAGGAPPPLLSSSPAVQPVDASPSRRKGGRNMLNIKRFGKATPGSFFTDDKAIDVSCTCTRFLSLSFFLLLSLSPLRHMSEWYNGQYACAYRLPVL